MLYGLLRTPYSVQTSVFNKYEIPCIPGKIRGPVPCFDFQYNLLGYSELVLVQTYMEHYKAISSLVREPGARSEIYFIFRFRFNRNFRKGVYCISTQGQFYNQLATNFPFHRIHLSTIIGATQGGADPSFLHPSRRSKSGILIARFPFLAPKNAAGAAGQVNLACLSAMSSAPYGVASDAHVLVTLVPVRFFVSCFWGGNVMGLNRDMKYLYSIRSR